jgi:hypothetical protein
VHRCPHVRALLLQWLGISLSLVQAGVWKIKETQAISVYDILNEVSVVGGGWHESGGCGHDGGYVRRKTHVPTWYIAAAAATAAVLARAQ